MDHHSMDNIRRESPSVKIYNDYYGRVDSLGARYVSVRTRDGIVFLITLEAPSIGLNSPGVG